MTITISASFQDRNSARRAVDLLRASGYRVSMGGQRPAWPESAGVCPGSGLPVRRAVENAVLLPDKKQAVVTVLVQDDSAGQAAGILRRCGGTPFR